MVNCLFTASTLYPRGNSDLGLPFLAITFKIRIYTAGKFTVEDSKLVYYRKPKDIQILGCSNISTGQAYTANVECELKDDICEIIADEAAAILAGDIESMNQYQREVQNAQRNS